MNCEFFKFLVVEPCQFYLENRFCKFRMSCMHLHDDKMTDGVLNAFNELKRIKSHKKDKKDYKKHK